MSLARKLALLIAALAVAGAVLLVGALWLTVGGGDALLHGAVARQRRSTMAARPA